MFLLTESQTRSATFTVDMRNISLSHKPTQVPSFFLGVIYLFDLVEMSETWTLSMGVSFHASVNSQGILQANKGIK